ncbi:MAG TPA: hypothetical protein VFM34_00160 [Moraxellaceae bacterium]|nr:hypothetical protein [Moraxellaceae bacterium]
MPATAAATVATVVAVNAAIQSEHAQDVACQNLLTTFNAAGSTPAGRRAYAECVDRIEPVHTAESDHTDKIIVGSGLILALLGAIIGAWWAGWCNRVGGAIFGFVTLPLAAAVLVSIAAAVQFAFFS